ncbi:unnamed protein product [Darwinula stevensoni]|uniref:non-specific serine/threonine protein kinase n=1 Tax=Darwinula stevensoni TaxID=69355 RepID=A0A7R9A9R1_9CRUS|nr:unnamed protein product [Darwinula stevensoni]CAG0897546.1 unnamed protein product [Darwinula stevensoni]
MRMHATISFSLCLLVLRARALSQLKNEEEELELKSSIADESEGAKYRREKYAKECKETAVEKRRLTFFKLDDAYADSKNSAIVPEDILLVSALEGSLTAVGKETGAVRWRFQYDPVIKVLSETKTSQLFLPDPKDGSLYMLQTGRSGMATVKMLPFTIPEVISASPTLATDGIFFSGKKVEKWIAIDNSTGFAQEVSNFVDRFCPFDTQHSLLISRTDYTITVLDSHNPHQSWDLIFSDYYANEMTAPMIEGYDLTHLAGNSDGYLLTLNRKDGKLHWKRDFQSPIVAIYLIQHEGLLRVPFTTLASDMLSGIISRLSVDVWKANFIGERKLLSTLNIGQYEHALYVLLTFGDASIVEISSGLVHSHILPIQRPIHAEKEFALPAENPAQEYLTNEELDWVLIDHCEWPGMQCQIAAQGQKVGFTCQNKEIGFEMDVILPDPFFPLSSEVIQRGPKMIPRRKDEGICDPLRYDIIPAIIKDFFNLLDKMQRILQALDIVSLMVYILLSLHQPSGKIKVGKILFFSSHVLGKGCDGTFVYKGEFDSRPVAVKRLLPGCFTVADREVTLLRESDQHPNVIRYFCMEQDHQFHYTALELCAATLQEYIQGEFDQSLIQPLPILQQATCGLNHLHSLGIVHRDIKPSNILLSMPMSNGEVRAKISDFGLCKKLQAGQMSFSRNSGVAGTEGWIAPEMAHDDKRSTWTVDIFSLGCVIYYALTKGNHRFVYSAGCKDYIRSGDSLFLALNEEDKVLAHLLVEAMISHEPGKRPSTSVILKFPLFWSNKKICDFFQDASDRVEKAEKAEKAKKERDKSDLLKNLESGSAGIVQENWLKNLGPAFVDDLQKTRRQAYDGRSVKDLLRAVRNKVSHLQDLPKEVQEEVGDNRDKFIRFWIACFPLLLPHVWLVMQAVKHEPMFQQYFEEDYYW